MLHIPDILTAIKNKWRLVPEVMQAVGGDPEAIVIGIASRPNTPSYDALLKDLPWPGILVTHVNTVLGFRGNFTHWRHTFRADIKLADEDPGYFHIMRYLVDGIPEDGQQLTLMQCSFIDDCDSMEDVSFVREIDIDAKDFYRMEFALQEKL